MKTACGVLMAGLFAMVVSAPRLATGEPVAPTVGYVEIVIPAQSQAIVSTPFAPADSSLDAVLAGQLTASTNLTAGDCVLVWDATKSRYRTAAALRTDDGNVVWVETDCSETNAEPIVGSAGDEFRLEPGRAVILWNRQDYTQTVRLAGQVVLDADRSVPVSEGLGLVALPYTTAKALADTRLAEFGRLSGADAFRQGEGYWVETDRRRNWQEPRPYANPFDASNAPVSIAEIVFDGDRPMIDIRIDDPTVKAVDVLVLDLDPGSVVREWTGWRLVAAGLNPEGSTVVHWRDEPPHGSSFFKGVRLYLVLRADSTADANGDGIPDQRERFTDESGRRGGRAVKPSGSDPVSPLTVADRSSVAEVRTNTVDEVVASPVSLPLVVYVDIKRGNDLFTGLVRAGQERLDIESRSNAVPVKAVHSAPVEPAHGPKRTIREGLRSVAPGGLLVIEEGRYGEHLNVQGKDVTVRIEGHVDLSAASGAVEQSSDVGPPSHAIPAVLVEQVTGGTNDVTSVSTRLTDAL
jgi:hypothetical protein